MAKTLADKVSRNFSKVKVRKISVKVPRLRAGKALVKIAPKKEIPVSSIINIIIKSAVEKAKRERIEKIAENGKAYSISKEDKELIVNGGYGTLSKGYGIAPQASYVDYGKLFSYLGKFRTKNAYDNTAPLEDLNKPAESGSFVLADKETMEKGKFYVRYVNSKIPIDKTSLVPIAGMNSAEWEQFKLWMRLDTAMYLLKISTS